MTLHTAILNYRSHALETVQIDGQVWLRMGQLVPPLGLSDTNSVGKIYLRNADEFTADETRLVSLPSESGMQETRVFSLRGARLLALLARTPEAKAFRRWVLDLLEGRARVACNGEEGEMGPGDACFFPADAEHLFQVIGDTPVRVLVIYAPPYGENPEKVVRRTAHGG